MTIPSRGLKRNIYVLFLYSLLRGIGVSIFSTLYPMYLYKTGYSMFDIGIIITIANLLISILTPFIGMLTDYYGRKPLIILTGLFLVFALILAGYTKAFIMVIAYTFSILSFMAGQPARGALLAESVSPEKMGEAFGFVSTSFVLSRVLIPPIAGYTADVFGYQYILNRCINSFNRSRYIPDLWN